VPDEAIDVNARHGWTSRCRGTRTTCSAIGVTPVGSQSRPISPLDDDGGSCRLADGESVAGQAIQASGGHNHQLGTIGDLRTHPSAGCWSPSDRHPVPGDVAAGAGFATGRDHLWRTLVLIPKIIELSRFDVPDVSARSTERSPRGVDVAQAAVARGGEDRNDLLS
jgi:hypothetical protein